MKRRKMLSVAMSLALFFSSNMPIVQAVNVPAPDPLPLTDAQQAIKDGALTGNVSTDNKEKTTDYNEGLGQNTEEVQKALENLVVEEQKNQTSTVENMEAMVPSSNPNSTGDTMIRKNVCYRSKDEKKCPPEATTNVCYTSGTNGYLNCVQEKVNNLEYITNDGYAANGEQIARLNGSKAYSLAQIAQMKIPKGQKVTLALLSLLNQQEEQEITQVENVASQNISELEEQTKKKNEQEINQKAKKIGNLQEANYAFTVNGKPANSQNYYLTFVLNPTVPTIDDGSDVTLTIKRNPNSNLSGNHSISVAFQNQVTGETVKQIVDVDSGIPVVLAKKDRKSVGDYTVRVTIHREKETDVNYTLNYRVSQMIATIMSDGKYNTASVASLVDTASANALNGTSKKVVGRVENAYWDASEKICKIMVQDNEKAGVNAVIRSRNINQEDCASYKNSDKPYVYFESVSTKINADKPEYEDGYIVFEDTALNVEQMSSNEYNAKIDDINRTFGMDALSGIAVNKYTEDGILEISDQMAGANGVDFLQVGNTTVPVKYDKKNSVYVYCNANGIPLTDEEKAILSKKLHMNLAETEIKKGEDSIAKIYLGDTQVSGETFATTNVDRQNKVAQNNRRLTNTVVQEVIKTAEKTTNPPITS